MPRGWIGVGDMLTEPVLGGRWVWAPLTRSVVTTRRLGFSPGLRVLLPRSIPDWRAIFTKRPVQWFQHAGRLASVPGDA